MSNREIQKDDVASQEKIIELLRDMVGLLLEKEVQPKLISYTMTFVAAELGFLSASNMQNVYPVLLSRIVEASASMGEGIPTTDVPFKKIDQEILEQTNETLH